MVPLTILNGLLIVVVAAWLAAGLAIVLDHALHDTRTKRLQRLRSQLASDAANALAPVAGRPRRTATRLAVADFEQMALEGLPPAIETALALDVQARAGGERLRRRAGGGTDGNVWQRIGALQVLASSRQAEAYPALDRALRSNNQPLATAALRMLSALDDRHAAAVLVFALLDGGYSRSRVAAALDRMTVPRGELLAPLFSGIEPAARFWAARLAGRIGAGEWIDAVRALSADDSPLVRRAAVEALGALGSAADRDLLLARFSDPVAFVRAHAARASTAHADSLTAARLVDLLGDREWIVRAAARGALEKIGAAATEPLVAMLWNADRFASDSAADVLFQTGTIEQLARRMLEPAVVTPESIAVLERFMAVAGVQRRQALLARFAGNERKALVRLLNDRLATG